MIILFLNREHYWISIIILKQAQRSENEKQKKIRHKVLERFEWMKKRAPKLIDMIELDFTNNTVSARTSTPAIDTLDEKQKVRMHEEGKKISKGIKTESNFVKGKGYKSFANAKEFEKS